MRNSFTAGLLVGALFLPSAAAAWWDEGHMRIAAMAYELLTPAARTEANRLIRLNPKYAEWASAVPATPDGSPKVSDVVRPQPWLLASRHRPMATSHRSGCWDGH